MANRGRTALVLGALSLSLMLLYQNCGPNEYGLRTFHSRDPVPLYCNGDPACDRNQENLWLFIDSNPSVFNDRTDPILGGDCSDGGFPANEIKYRVAHKQVPSQDWTSFSDWKVTECSPNGRFHMWISLCDGGLDKSCDTAPGASDRFGVQVQLRGVFDGKPFFNPYPGSSDKELNISFIN